MPELQQVLGREVEVVSKIDPVAAADRVPIALIPPAPPPAQPSPPPRIAPEPASAPLHVSNKRSEVWEQADGGLGAARRAAGRGNVAPGAGQGKLVAVIVVGVVLLLIVIGSLSGSRTGQEIPVENAVPAGEALANDTATAEAGQAIAEGTAYDWTDNGSPQTYATEGLQLVLTSEDNGEGGKVPVMTVHSADLGDSKVVGVAGGDTASAKFMVLRPTRTDRFPAVLLMTYSMGAHCCTSFKLLTPKGGAWTLADLGEWDGGPLDSAPADIDGDGRLDFVMRDNAFLYAFASYADSWTPSLVYNVVDGRFVDRTTSARFRSLHAADMQRMRDECAKHNNGACAAFVASAARIGQQAEALQFAAANFDPAATQGWLPARCRSQLVDGSCPAASEVQPGGFVEALDWFLQDHGYVEGSIQPAFQPEPEPSPDASASPPASDESIENKDGFDGTE